MLAKQDFRDNQKMSLAQTPPFGNNGVVAAAIFYNQVIVRSDIEMNDYATKPAAPAAGISPSPSTAASDATVRVRLGDGVKPWVEAPKVRIGDGVKPW